MAKKNDRKEYNKLKKKKADNKKQQEQCQSEIDVLDEKIERLKAAYRKLDDAKEAIDDIKHNQRNMINSDLYQCMWTGSNAQECYDSCESGNLYTAYDGYVSNIDAAEDAINWEINTLKEKMNEKKQKQRGFKQGVELIYKYRFVLSFLLLILSLIHI